MSSELRLCTCLEAINISTGTLCLNITRNYFSLVNKMRRRSNKRIMDAINCIGKASNDCASTGGELLVDVYLDRSI